MMNKRKAFNFYRSYYDVLKMLEKDSDKCAFIKAVCEKQFEGTNPDFSKLSPMVEFAYKSQKHALDASRQGFEDVGKRKKNTPPSVGGTEAPSVGVNEGGTEAPSVQVQVQVQEEEEGKGKEKVKSVKEREQNFAKQVRSLNFDLPDTEIQKFIIHWTEKNPKGRKLRFEKEKTFDLKRRLIKWKSNYEQWNSKQTKTDKPRHSNDIYSPECYTRLTGAAKKIYELYSGDVKKVDEAKDLKQKIWAALTTTEPAPEATKAVYVKINKYYESKLNSTEKLKGIDNFLNEI